MKFGRTYKLTIDTNDGLGQIIITPPLTINFTVERTVESTSNTISIQIYNLSMKTRNRIKQDKYNMSAQHKIKLEAGYGNNLSVIYYGQILQADNMRAGQDIITTVSGQDGSFDTSNTVTSESIAAGTPVSQVLQHLVGQFPTLTLGAIGDFPGVFNKTVTLEGNCWELLKQYAPGKVYIDKGQVFLLNPNEAINGVSVVAGQIPIMDSSTGLLDTPRRENAFLTIRTLFEPRITVGQILQLNSSVQPAYNGQYKVVGLGHQGMISEAVCGTLESKFSLLLGQQYYGSLTTVATAKTSVAN